MDTVEFFSCRKPSWTWSRLASLALASQLLSPDKSLSEIDRMLPVAVAATTDMPKLKILMIWTGREGLAMLFRYQVIGGRAELTTRETWKFSLRPSVVQAWEATTQRHNEYGSLLVIEELLDPGVLVKSHGDAIHHLKLLNPVVRPISLRQIRMECF